MFQGTMPTVCSHSRLDLGSFQRLAPSCLERTIDFPCEDALLRVQSMSEQNNISAKQVLDTRSIAKDKGVSRNQRVVKNQIAQ